MRRNILFVLVVLTAMGGIHQEVFAQLSNTSRQTMFGSRTLGGFPTAGTRTFSGSSLGGSSLGGSSLSGLGSSFGRTSTGVGRSSLGGGMGTLQLSGSERFMRGARQPGQFVGADTQDVSGILSTLGAGSRTMSNQNFNARSLSGQSRNRVNQPGNQPGGPGQVGRSSRGTGQLTVALELGFEPPQPAPGAVLSQQLTSKIGQSKRIQTVQPIEVFLAEDGTAVLKGVVATPHDRELAGQWLLLEPGVRAVRNELQVAPGASGSTGAESPQNR